MDFVGKANAQLQRIALDGAEVADALNLELLLVAFCDPNQHIVDERPREAMVSANIAFFRIARANHGTAIDLDRDFRAMRVCEFAEFSLDSHSAIGGDVDFDAGRHWNRFLTNT